MNISLAMSNFANLILSSFALEVNTPTSNLSALRLKQRNEKYYIFVLPFYIHCMITNGVSKPYKPVPDWLTILCVIYRKLQLTLQLLLQRKCTNCVDFVNSCFLMNVHWSGQPALSWYHWRLHALLFAYLFFRNGHLHLSCFSTVNTKVVRKWGELIDFQVLKTRW